MLHRTRTILLATLALATGHATAATYTFQGSSYQQLQRTDTYETVCQSGSRCNVPAGTYTLIDFGTSPATRTSVTVGSSSGSSPGASSSPDFFTVAETCRFSTFDPSTLTPAVPELPAGPDNRRYACSASCPAGATFVGAAGCSLTWDNDAQEPSASEAVGFSTSGNTLTCAANDTRQPFQTSVGLTVAVAARCAR